MPLVAVGVLVTTDWLGYGLLAMFPSTTAQHIAGAALPAAIVLLVAVRTWWPVTAVRPPALAGAAWGSGRGHVVGGDAGLVNE
ncbi:hypothetical protein SAMN05661080_04138 [Modestobacter sp. DSM 44400]|uniref:hypothetical protein n=1 Tax=Modestobacter sp. DSM 44400 TaxID=1550230 RepID=UPI00089C6D21|nr:hypothetical protein [Modestobacter sp. DSM 44400]SDY64036.1 hypothetical protein SAMN05661080_04138 [Modestobacter sp. DSM 44400]